MINRVQTEGRPSQFIYYLARIIEFIAPTILFALAAVAAFYVFRPAAILVALLYAALLFVWVNLAAANRPVHKQWRSTLEGRAGSAELWQLYAAMTEQMRRARYIEAGDTAVEDEGQETDNAVALYKHPLINLLRVPASLTDLLGFGKYYKYLQGGATVVMLQYPDLHFSGSRDAWQKIRPKLPIVNEEEAAGMVNQQAIKERE